ncbi:low affinity iron permease family protein [Candidatus Woesebacteria bacterium]|nr:low affinity iron permease family protein [Candidatus Woesebacteria bacterium]
MENLFQRISTKVAVWMGSAGAFVWSMMLVAVWAITGPWFNYSDSWQLVINTGTTVATFLMVFLIQNTQNRDAKAIHIKLDELIKAEGKARNGVVSAEELSEKELDHLLAEFHDIHEKYEKEITKKGGKKIKVTYSE